MNIVSRHRPNDAYLRPTREGTQRICFDLALLALLCGVILSLMGCPLSRGQRWDGGTVEADGEVIQLECGGDPLDDFACLHRDGADIFIFCEREQEFYRISEQNCSEAHLLCNAQPPYDNCEEQNFVGTEAIGCSLCHPCQIGCDEGHIAQCSADGTAWTLLEYCDHASGEVCEGGVCVNGCEIAIQRQSNVGCEYWAVDLDNAVDHGLSAASQQFAVVVSNPSDSNEAHVSIHRCNAQPCSNEANLEEVAYSIVNRRDLEVYELDAREVDGSPDGEFNTGSGTALGPRAYRITSSWPIIAYQFNPLDNVPAVFSNDASMLLPTSALDRRYSIMSWPQTIADAPGEVFDSEQDFGAFLTIVSLVDETQVSIRTTAPIIPSGETPPVVPFTSAGETLELTLDSFDVLNLETGYHDGQHSFLADFTGSIVESNQPVAVFSGVEATDVPIWNHREERLAAADHLEQQQWPERTLGFSFVIGHTPRRTLALAETGAIITPLTTEPEWYRIMAVEDGTEITTTIPGEENIELNAMEFVTLESDTHFTVRANQPIAVGQYVAGQDTTGILWNYPGGDPAFILIPPIEQWRAGYVFLTPNKYMFDFLIISVAAESAPYVELDGHSVATLPNCWRERADGLPPSEPVPPEYYVITCSLSLPRCIGDENFEAGPNLEIGEISTPPYQSDRPHEIYVVGGTERRGLGIVVYGFDRYVSYGYAGGTDLRTLQ